MSDVIVTVISSGAFLTILEGPEVLMMDPCWEKVVSLVALKASTKSSTSFRFIEVRAILFTLLSSDCTNFFTANETVSVYDD